MRTRHTIFNVLGLTFALIFTVSGCGQLTQGGPGGILLWTALVALLVGGGSIANLSERRLAVGPTVAMIIGYCAAFFLIPFAIWGLIELIIERNRPRRRR